MKAPIGMPQSQKTVVGRPIKWAQCGCFFPLFRCKPCLRGYDHFQSSAIRSQWLETSHHVWFNEPCGISMDELLETSSHLKVFIQSKAKTRHVFGSKFNCLEQLDIAGALRAVQAILPKLEAKMIEFLAEWMVTLLMPASHVLEVRAPHLSFMMLKEYWFRELYLGLKVTASFDRSESYTRVIDGQVRCITPEVKPQNLQVIWNVQFITVFVPAWMIPPVYHSLRRESIKTASSASPIGVQSVRPTWFEDTTPKDATSQPPQDPPKEQPQLLHGLN